ncbi:uncharacterized protein BJ212DRAFT_1372933, partial [Suillus subaureus]
LSGATPCYQIITDFVSTPSPHIGSYIISRVPLTKNPQLKKESAHQPYITSPLTPPQAPSPSSLTHTNPQSVPLVHVSLRGRARGVWLLCPLL